MVNPKHISLVLACLFALSVGLIAQDGKAYAGVWEGRFKDSVFCVLRIEADGKITGTLSAGNIKMNDEGELVEAEGSEKDFPILNPKLYEDRLTFDWKDEGDDTAVKFEMKLTGTGKAGLRVIFDGFRNFKPWLLTRK
jgi:hypothetical protein